MNEGNPNSKQYLHEAVFLYFLYKDLVQCTYSRGYDHRQPEYMLKLVHLLLKYGANITPYKVVDVSEMYDIDHYSKIESYTPKEFILKPLVSLAGYEHSYTCLENNKKKLDGITINLIFDINVMNGVTPLEYASRFQNEYPEMFVLLKKYQESQAIKYNLEDSDVNLMEYKFS